MQRHGDGNGRSGGSLLHNDMASFPAHLDKACLVRMEQTSRPESLRSLPKGDLQRRHVNFSIESLVDLSRMGALQEQLDSFF